MEEENDRLTSARKAFSICAVAFGLLALAIDKSFGDKALGLYFTDTLNLRWWIDVIPHGLGGIACGLLAAIPQPWETLVKRRRLVVFCCLTALGIGLLWEGYEIVSGYNAREFEFNTPEFNYYQFNLWKDLVVDCLGGLVASLAISTACIRVALTEPKVGSPA